VFGGSENFEVSTEEVGSPFLQRLDNGEKFLLMYWVIFLSIVELAGVVGNWSGSFPSCTEAQYRAGAAVTGIGGYINVRRLIFVIYYGETVSSNNQVFDVFKGGLVFRGPCGKLPITFLGGERREHTRVFGECW